MCIRDSSDDERTENTVYYATVKAEVVDRRTGEVHMVAYNIAQFDVLLPFYRRNPLLTVGALIIVVLLTALLIMWARYQRIKRRIVVELKDIRNIAAINNDDVSNSGGVLEMNAYKGADKFYQQ
eukprot:TRINITY_DN6679_c0_g1_i6.p1 TRINITY_DN6679_c0_g1~~TRINITY_DN6679_c0_g1_i6.p1  ORF type:complete len:139 (-),score=29.45 TRINITY_DN6679_c0_g1_i6:84-455(-)